MKNTKHVEILVLGGGPGGYLAAIRAAKSGKSVALIEAGDMGGTCLNRGCIPTKTLIANADVLKKIRDAEAYGIDVGKIAISFDRMKRRNDELVAKMRKGLDGLVTSHHVEIFRGHGKFESPHEIKVLGKDNILISADKIIIATGSEPKNISAFPFDHTHILSSTSILQWEALPRHLVIVGGGVIGCEFASLYHALGVEITVVEALPTILSTEAKICRDALAVRFQKRGIKILTDAKVQSIDNSKKGVIVHLEGAQPITADCALVAVGRKLNTDAIAIERAGVALSGAGTIPVNEHMQTNVPHIYAVGDVTAKWMLAHVASHQGIVAACHVLGDHKASMHYEAIPSIVFTDPEIASVGMSLEKALENGFDAVTGNFPFQALGKAQAARETDGFTHIVVEKKTGRILGAQVMGHDASNLIAEMSVAIQNELTVECIAGTVHAHPTIAEAWLESAFLSIGIPLHLPPTKRKNLEPIEAL